MAIRYFALVYGIVFLLVGIWGLIGWRSVSGSLTYARAVAVVYAILFVMGLIPGLDTTFGLIPLYGHDVWLHAVLAAVAAYFGFMARADTGAAAHA